MYHLVNSILIYYLASTMLYHIISVQMKLDYQIQNDTYYQTQNALQIYRTFFSIKLMQFNELEFLKSFEKFLKFLISF